MERGAVWQMATASTQRMQKMRRRSKAEECFVQHWAERCRLKEVDAPANRALASGNIAETSAYIT